MGGKKKENMMSAPKNTSNCGSLSAAFSRRKTMLATSNSRESSDVEEDCGFKFQRKQQPTSPALKKVNKTKPMAANDSTTTSNKATENKKLRNRRKSLIASSAVANARRKSSITIPLSQDLPPAAVPVKEFYRHLMPDLPGPAKLRQLLVWCTQAWIKRKQNSITGGNKRTNGKKNSKKEVDEVALAEHFSNALASHQFNTSWYQRPITETETARKRNPENVELEDTIFLLEHYRDQLKNEMEQWEELEKQILLQDEQKQNQQPIEIQDILIKEREGADQVGSWFNTQVPVAIDGLKWSVQMLETFQERSRTYCEDVFHQIFEQLNLSSGNTGETPFAGTATVGPGKKKLEPMLILRALSRPKVKNH